jgi:hypothetical protein
MGKLLYTILWIIVRLCLVRTPIWTKIKHITKNHILTNSTIIIMTDTSEVIEFVIQNEYQNHIKKTISRKFLDIENLQINLLYLQSRNTSRHGKQL